LQDNGAVIQTISALGAFGSEAGGRTGRVGRGRGTGLAWAAPFLCQAEFGGNGFQFQRPQKTNPEILECIKHIKTSNSKYSKQEIRPTPKKHS